MATNELQAVILAAGKGSRISELTANHPKCLLPIGNKPLIYYSIDSLIKAQFEEVIIIVTDIHEELINKQLIELKLEIRFELFSIPFNRDFATADSLRLIKDKIKSDLLIISCDTITDFPLKRLIDLYRINDSTLISLISSIPSNNESSIPGRKGRDKPEKDLIGIDRNNSDRLVFLSSEVDFDESVPLSVSMIKKCPQFNIETNLMDAHIYILKKWTLKYIEENAKISSLKGEFLPSLVRKQFRKERKPTPNKTSTNPSSIISMSAIPHRQIFNFIDTNDIEIGLQKLEPNVENDDFKDELKLKQLLPNSYPDSKIKCFAHIVNEGFCIRANTLSGFCEANRIILRQLKTSKISTNVNIKSQVDGIIGNIKSIGEKASIKRSIIGNNCTIGDKVKLMNTIIMDNVTVEEGSNIQGSIICNNAHIGSNAEIKDCIIAANQTVVSLGKFTNEVIMDIEQMMEL